MGLLSSLFGGGDSTSTSTSNTTNQQFDQRATTGADGVALSNASNNVITRTQTDFGAVQAGIELARTSTALAILSAEDAATKAQNVFSGALAEVGKAYETAKAGDQRVVSMVGMALVALAVITVLPSVFRKG